jgi:hypothetical protein
MGDYEALDDGQSIGRIYEILHTAPCRTASFARESGVHGDLTD